MQIIFDVAIIILIYIRYFFMESSFKYFKITVISVAIIFSSLSYFRFAFKLALFISTKRLLSSFISAFIVYINLVNKKFSLLQFICFVNKFYYYYGIIRNLLIH